MPSKRDIAKEILRRYPQSHADRLGIDVAKGTPAPLYQWLVASLLFSARISAAQAENAARALFAEGWRTPKKMAAVNPDQEGDFSSPSMDLPSTNPARIGCVPASRRRTTTGEISLSPGPHRPRGFLAPWNDQTFSDRYSSWA